MGTTFAGVLLLARCAVIAHVGDSRVYRLRGGELERLTEDHSLAHHLVEMGFLRPEEVATFPRRNVITRAVGPHESVEVDTRIVDVRPGDAFLLCSDGLHGELDDDEIAAILRERRDPGDGRGAARGSRQREGRRRQHHGGAGEAGAGSLTRPLRVVARLDARALAVHVRLVIGAGAERLRVDGVLGDPAAELVPVHAQRAGRPGDVALLGAQRGLDGLARELRGRGPRLPARGVPRRAARRARGRRTRAGRDP